MTSEPHTNLQLLTRRVGGYSGTLILLPILILFFGTDWRIHSEIGFSSFRVNDSQSTSVDFAFLPEDTLPDEGVMLDGESYLQLSLPMSVEEFTLTLQADHNDQYRVSASVNGDRFVDFGTMPDVADTAGLQTRGPVLFALPEPIRFLRLHPRGDEPYSVSGVSLEQITSVHPVYMIPLLWGSWFLLGAAERRYGPRSFPARMLAGWGRIDVWLATGLAYLVLFRVPPLVAAFGLAVAAVYVLMRWITGRMQTAPLRYALGISSALLLSVVLLRGGMELFVRAVVGRVYDLTVDHRMRPDQDEINEDGIRFRGSSAEIEEADYVVLFLGDSFTQGVLLDYPEAYPYVFEQLATAGTCSARLRAINFGWTSSSPLLSLRLLQDIGQKYKPDLIVYSLDMTDFHDDLRYEVLLRQGGDFELDTTKLFAAMANVSVLASFRDSDLGQAFIQLIRKVDRLWPNAGLNLPGDRFFITSQPLDEKTGSQPTLKKLLGQGLTVLVAPHHGLESCYSKELFAAMRGSKPSLNVLSERRKAHDGDGTTDARYQSEAGARGLSVDVDGNPAVRRSVSTKNGHHILTVIFVLPAQDGPCIHPRAAVVAILRLLD